MATFLHPQNDRCQDQVLIVTTGTHYLTVRYRLNNLSALEFCSIPSIALNKMKQ